MSRMVKAKIFGKVQGVFFRDYTSKEAKKLGLKGWVCNCDDGTVEAVLAGEDESIAKMINWLHTGSPLSEVERVDIEDMEDMDPADLEPDFTVRY